jgi:serine/threonine-protein kinase
MAAIAADRNLLFGLLALQNGLVNQVQLVGAFQAWTLDRARALADHFIALGHLNEAQRTVVEALADLHLAKHGDVERSLAAISAGRSTHESLALIGDSQIQATLARLGSALTDRDQDAGADSDRTASYAVGTATSDGQRFRVLRPHARGGLGAVFVALDDELHREVALKQILHQHADDPTSRQRFVLEAEITGGLEHPGIVPVYGLGTYGDGRPYYAMRFIKGDSLKEAIEQFHGEPGGVSAGSRSPKTRGADATPLALRKLLRRFIDVCNAIDYAHSRGVLHRDIKPGNIIVGKHGETLVVDWGLAKLLRKDEGERMKDEKDPDAAIPASSFVLHRSSLPSETLPGSALGTPSYMSPEQAEGNLEGLGPRSDVYSLGATLYCLLTGKVPFEGDDIGEVLRRVQKGQFARPRTLDPSIDGALEAVCVKAMATKPEDRYGSCRALADDIERWMADEPVVAWREPVARQARRWMRRHQTAVATLAATVLVSVVGLCAVLLVQSRANRDLVASNERERQRFDLAVEAVRKFHTGVSEDVLLKQADFKELRTRLLRDAQNFYRKLGGLLQGRTDTRSRVALARAHSEVAELTGRIGNPDEALAELRGAITAWRALAAEPGEGPDAWVGVARGLVEVGQLEVGLGLSDRARADYEEARGILDGINRAGHATQEVRALFASMLSLLAMHVDIGVDKIRARDDLERARNLQQRLIADDPGHDGYRADLAETDKFLGSVLWSDRDRAGAIAAWSRARDELERLTHDYPDVLSYRERLQGSYSLIGSFRDDAAEALAFHDRAVALGEQLVQASPAVHRYWADLASAHQSRAFALARLERNAEALAAHGREQEIRERLARTYPADTRYTSALTWSLISQASRADQGKDPAQALDALERARGIAERMAADRPDVPRPRADLAYTLTSIAELKARTGKITEALAAHKRACELYRANVTTAPDDPLVRAQVAGAESCFGSRLADIGQVSEAEAAYRRAVAAYDGLMTDERLAATYLPGLAMTWNSIGNLLIDLGRYDEARASFERALELRTRAVRERPNDHWQRSDLAQSEHNLGWLNNRLGKAEPALAHYRRSRELRESLVRELPNERWAQFYLGEICRELGHWLLDLGRTEEAREPLERALALQEPLARMEPGNTSYRAGLAYTLRSAAYLHRVTKAFAEGEPLIRRAIDILDALARVHPESFADRNQLAVTVNHLGLLLFESGRPAEAIPPFDRALALNESLVRESPRILDWVSLSAGIRNNHGLALAGLGRHEEAMDDYRQAIAIERRCLDRSPQSDQYRTWLGYHHRNLGKSLRALGRLDESYEAAVAGYRLQPDRRESIYNYACDLAVLSGLLGRRLAGLIPAERNRQTDWADRAVAELRRAIDAGFRDVDLIVHDPDFDSIRSRTDFRDAVIHAIFQVDPFAH